MKTEKGQLNKGGRGRGRLGGRLGGSIIKSLQQVLEVSLSYQGTPNRYALQCIFNLPIKLTTTRYRNDRTCITA
jgi:hypothetical protein